MSYSIINALRVASQQVTIYGNFLNLIGGVLGNCLNVIVFLSLKTFRQSTCSFYLIIISFVNIGQLLTGALSRVLISGFSLDLTTSSVAYCKTRVYLLQFFGPSSLGLLCLATIDQYFATCSRTRWQNWSNIKTVRWLSFFMMSFWLLINVPYFILYDVRTSTTTGRKTCGNINSYFDRYHLYWQRFTIQGCLPNLITILFGFLTHLNIKSLAYRTVPFVRRESDKQLSSMLFVQVIFNIFALLFFNIMSIVSPYVTSFGDETSTAIVQFIEIVSFCFYYLYFACPFYIYICVSERFRRQFFYVFFVKIFHCFRKQRVGTMENQSQESVHQTDRTY